MATSEDLLTRHLSAAIHVELWTIPLYLAAAYSLQVPEAPLSDGLPVPRPTPPDPDNGPLSLEQRAFNLLYSVATQEMFHLELVCNLASALGVRPRLTDAPPIYGGPEGIPYLKEPRPPDGPYRVRLGALDLNQANLFLAVELPSVLAPHHGAPRDPDEHETLGELYAALRQLVEQEWATRYDPDSVQKTEFSTSYPDIPIAIRGSPDEALARALAAIDTITSQGEGTKDGVPADDIPAAPTDLSTEDQDEVLVCLRRDCKSHYWRFRRLKALVGRGLRTWPRRLRGAREAQRQLDVAFSAFLRSIEDSYDVRDDRIALDAMWSLSEKIVAVFAAGGVPRFQYTPVEAPYALELHACQGLNACAGHGFGGSGTMPGDGDCATALEHTCGGTNECRGQGGCGYRTVPNENACKGQGGCGAPIPAAQVFHIDQYKGQLVWDQARALLEARMAAAGREVAPRPGAPSRRRKALQPT